MIKIDDIFIETEVFEAEFACDLGECKGACCTFPGDYGAPVTNEEAEVIKTIAEDVYFYLPDRSVEILKKIGPVEGKPNDYSTVCINRKDCVFVYYENDVAKCGIEKAFFDGKIDFRKPVSCHLYPIRERAYASPTLVYSKIDECRSGRKKGAAEKIKLIDFLEKAFERAYGKEWVEKLKIELERIERRKK